MLGCSHRFAATSNEAFRPRESAPKVGSAPKEKAMGGIEHALMDEGIYRPTNLRPSPATSSYHEKVTCVSNVKARHEGRRRGKLQSEIRSFYQ